VDALATDDAEVHKRIVEVFNLVAPLSALSDVGTTAGRAAS
jgi:hypothetical protein